MATAKAERLLNLVIALVNSPQYRSAAWIRDKVAGYADAPNDEAFFRTFERDKQELRELGIPVQTPPAGSDGYRIPPVDFALPAVSLTPAEAAALALAGRLWETTALATAGSGGLRKIRDAIGGAEGAGPEGLGAATSETAAATLLQPRVRTGDPAFTPLYAAVRARRAVEFEYRKDPGTPAEPRRVQPWGLVSFRGRWYVIGYDEKRAERRTFRLSRIAGAVKTVGRAGVVRTPAGLDLLQEVAESVERPADRTATVRIRPGRAAGLRRTAIAQVSGDPDWDRVTLPLGHLWDTARRIAGQGPDVVVEGPADLVAATVRLLDGSRRAMLGPAIAPGRPAPAARNVGAESAEFDGGGTLRMSDTG
ncbi:MAG: WYL domain-containing protein [Nakamurella sp.]